ncbi:hypothetical protein C8Q77DRAFT_538198 [Trametes polyzona]|nr:hypothetical protein C8Q77DRAFT_538198 [Trametes polyzona]
MPLRLGDFEARVAFGKREIQVFSPKQESQSVASGWITSEVTGEFQVVCECNSPGPVNVDIYIDGRYAQGLSHHGGKPSTLQCKGVHCSAHTIQRFRFSNLKLLEDNTAMYPNLGSLQKKLGTIEVVVTRVEGFTECTVENPGCAYEKTTAALYASTTANVHNVVLSKVAPNFPVKFITAVGVDFEPCARFIFHYRPTEILQALGIAPPVYHSRALRERANNMPPSVPRPTPGHSTSTCLKQKRPASAAGDQMEQSEFERRLKEMKALIEAKKKAHTAQPVVKVERAASPVLTIKREPSSPVLKVKEEPDSSSASLSSHDRYAVLFVTLPLSRTAGSAPAVGP